jgi:hypothetical protein
MTFIKAVKGLLCRCNNNFAFLIGLDAAYRINYLFLPAKETSFAPGCEVFMATRRTAKQVIDQAIADNKKAEWLLYGFSITFIALGVGLILWGSLHGDKVFAFIGTLAGTLFWPAMKYAGQIRRESIAIRLLEAPLSKAETEMAACEMLQKLFRDLMLEKSKESVPIVENSKIETGEGQVGAN